ncbi:ATP-binding protein [Streptomyces shenzhenensis]|uniref:sensor histidine kinase n=1 Tax=Streptomyces shenzhenensis TaxID=943815 RepID=UPI003407E148
MNPRRCLALLPFRTRLALAFGGLFLLAGIALMAFVVTLARYGTAQKTADIEVMPLKGPGIGNPSPAGPHPGDWGVTGAKPSLPLVSEGIAVRIVESTAREVQQAAVQQMLLWSGVGLIVTAVLAGLTGWWLAGRALRPVTAMTDTALRISETNLDERLALTGPDDELHRLAGTFDSMLDRLQRAFDSQRRFVANASHELRTPLAAQRTSIQVGLADPLPQHLTEVRDDLLSTNRHAEQLIASLLLLARSDRGLEHTERIDLAELTTTAAAELRAAAAEKGLTLHTRVRSRVQLTGDPVLISHLVSNLVHNAIQYNRPAGRVDVLLEGRVLTVTNTGRAIDADRVGELFEPFRRLGQDRVDTTGHGLGLSIVRSIAVAHGAELRAEPGVNGGLVIMIGFP